MLSRMKSVLIKAVLGRPLLGFSVLLLLIDILYVNYVWSYPKGNFSEAQMCTITGKVRDKAYDEKGKLKSFVVSNYLCYVNNDALQEPFVGSKVKVYGEISDFEGPMNYGEFDKQKYYASKKIYYTLTVSTLFVICDPKISLKESFLRLRRQFAEKIKESCPLEGGTINTLLLADKSGLKEERKELYTRAGVAHFLVISGLHVSAIGGALYSFIRRLGVRRNIACVFSVGFLLMYGLLVGFSVSVTRAVIMFGVRLFADIVKEIYDILSSVSLAMIISICVNPLSIMDSAFVYSYMTVFAIAFYITYLHPRPLRRIGVWGHIRELLRIPFVLCLFIMPVTLFVSYRYSLSSIIINACLAPASGPILLVSVLAFGGGVLGIGPVAGFFDFILALLLKCLDLLCTNATISDAFLMMGKPPVWRIVVYYFLLILFFAVVLGNSSLYISMVYITMALFIVGSPSFYKPEISMLYVGQGECIVIRTGKTSGIMIDCGSSSKSERFKYVVAPFLKAKGISKIRGVYVTHSDLDHMGEIDSLIVNGAKEGIRVDTLYLPDVKKGETDDKLTTLILRAEENDIPVEFLKRGMSVEYQNISTYILWPDTSNLSGDANADSLVMLARGKAFSVLLTGDATKETERKIAPFLSHVDILKVSHHGSKTGTSEELLKACSFDTAIISAGINNRYNHPAVSTIDTLKKYGIYIESTQNGQITILPKNLKMNRIK